MSEPFVFHFRPGPRGRPEAMYILDLDCRCALCFHEQFQRFYHSAPFHSLTLVGLDELADRAPLKAGYHCENCGEAVGSSEVRHSVLTYGFSDDAGIIRIFDAIEEKTRTYEVTARQRLDPQAQPRWTPDPDAYPRSHHVLDELREPDVDAHLGRPLNVKLAVRDRLIKAADDPENTTTSRISPDVWLVTSERSVSLKEMVDERDDADVADAHADGDLDAIELADSAPTGLPTHDDGLSLPGRWSTWLPDAVIDAIRRRRLRVTVFVRRSAAVETVERTFEVARLDYRRVENDDDVRFEAITTPTETVYPEVLSVSAVLRRAAFTGLTPGEAARLTAEEIVGRLLDVW